MGETKQDAVQPDVCTVMLAFRFQQPEEALKVYNAMKAAVGDMELVLSDFRISNPTLAMQRGMSRNALLG